MKQIYIILLCCLLSSYYSIGQGEEPICGEEDRGISTNPESPVNNHCNSQLNFFDWTQDIYTAPYYKGLVPVGQQTSGNTIQSPFDNQNNGAIAELWDDDNYADAIDNLHMNGWEIVVDGITQAQEGTPLRSKDIAYFVLYNKFTATLRVFGAHYNIDDRNEYISISLSFEVGASALLSPAIQIAQPLDQPSPREVQGSSYLDGSNELHFFYADFAMAYDPCTCIFTKGKLKVDFDAVNEQKIDLYGRSWGIDQSIASVAGGGVGNGSISGDYLANVYTKEMSNGQGNSIDQIEAGSLIFNTWNDLVTHYKLQKNNLTKLEEQYQAFENLSKALGLAAAVAEYSGIVIPTGGVPNSTEKGKFKLSTLKNPIKLAAKFVDVLGAPLKKKLDKAKKEVEAIGKVRMIQTEMAVTGAITDISNKGSFSFNLPGRAGDSGCDEDATLYPLYNEVLGRFALMKTPKINMGEKIVDVEVNVHPGRVTRQRKFTEKRFQIDVEFLNNSYLFNPAAKINPENTEIYAAVIIKTKRDSKAKTDLDEVESLSTDDETVFMTKFVPLSCVGNVVSSIRTDDFDGIDARIIEINEVKLRLLIFYEFDAINSENLKHQAFEVLTYPLEIENVEYGEISSPIDEIDFSSNSFQDNISLPTEQFNTSEIIFAWETVEITGDLTATAGTEVEIIAPEIIVSGGSIGAGITLKQGEYPIDCTPFSTFDTDGLPSYCESDSYQANQLKHKPIKEVYTDDIPVLQINFTNAPNPFEQSTEIMLTLSQEDRISITVRDILGKEVQTLLAPSDLQAGDYSYTFDGSQLPPGIYFATLQSHSDGNIRQTIKLVKK